MKTIFIKSLAFSLIAVLLWSCKKDETKTVANNGAAGSLKSSTASIILDKTMLDKNVITFSLTEANFGYQAAITNVLQMAIKGTNFLNAKEVIFDANSLSKGYNGLDFNNLLLSLNLPTATSTDVEMRIKSSISNSLTPVYSNVLTLSAKPFPLTTWIYVPGNYQGWNPASADSLVSLSGNNVYTGIIAFDGNNFKITPAKKWDIAYGDAGGGKLSTSGGDISSLSEGAKQLDVDLNNLTYTIKPLVWSIVGSATPVGWPDYTLPNKEIDMKYINDGKGLWKVTLNLTAGAIKFRKNHDWGTNFGGNAAGTLNGDDINITVPGNYTVTLDIPNNKYILTKN